MKSLRVLAVEVAEKSGAHDLAEKIMRSKEDGFLYYPCRSCGKRESQANQILSQAFDDWLKEARKNGGLEGTQALAALREAFVLEPLTQKSKLVRATDDFHQADDAWMETILFVAQQLPREAVEMLDDSYKRVIWRARTPKEDQVSNGDWSVRRFDRADRWYLYFQDSRVNDVYIKIGHLGTGSLELVVRENLTANGVKVVSLLLKHKREKRCHDNCRLPLACEVVYDKRGRRNVSYWREETSSEDPLLPHVGRKVRIGDVCLKAECHPKSSHFPSWADEEEWEEKPAGGRRDQFAWLPQSPQDWQWVKGKYCPDPYCISPEDFQGGLVEFKHPDHYTVSVLCDGDEVITAKQIRGMTQYREWESSSD